MLKKLLVIGGSGALGRGVAARFNAANWSVLNVDYAYVENKDTEANVTLKSDKSTLAQLPAILDAIKDNKVDAVVCAAGGWAGGSIADAETLENLATMYSMNMESALLAAHLAATKLNNGGLLVLTGSVAALNGTPDMVTYGMSKAATHHLIASSAPKLPQAATALGILPITIDTPTNRKYMADADVSTWTPVQATKVEEIGDKIVEWAQAPTSRPTSGGLVTVSTSAGKSTWKSIGNPFN
ncbi:dihydropteridine reductase [Thraustotheca clavata]|uniref:Dihydropteridine reductase n=1 Tax=Thraustotheca clavata TaxID=74557 RepID=A0A1W0A9M8_9STRA|nr:dihydropteridine reductase [Thraustotheca clavata]